MPRHAATTTDATLSAAEIDILLFNIEEEKLAGDVYEALADLYDLKIFDRIAASEDRHLDALLNQAERLGVDVSALPEEEGVFANAELQALYDDLIVWGSTSLTAALEVGISIETMDLTSLAESIELTSDATLDAVYASLLAGSESHLAAFTSTLDLFG
ncbi:MAG TPA: DUF2202 domain-containing protein [Roseomonas sp.]|nr:DUF2202 domain-containing protein [Roseomonas sp.]